MDGQGRQPGHGGEDVYGAAVAVNFADLTLRAAVSEDFMRWRPVPARAELVDVAEPR